MEKSNSEEWQRSDSKVFWGEIAPCDHVIQIYENDDVFLNLLEGYVAGGFRAEDAVIIIATAPHLKALEERLDKHGFDIIQLMIRGQYIPLNAEDTLNKFMVNGWPDEGLFIDTVSKLIERGKKNGRQVRAFGEMVAILWAEGKGGATVHLEHLWNKFAEKESFCLFCAYPKSGFTENASDSIKHICGTHTRILAGWNFAKNEVIHSAPLRKVG